MNIEIILIVIAIPILALSLYVLRRNEIVYRFRREVIDAMFKSKHWGELAEEFDYISYAKMTFSFKPLRIEKWYSEDFCKKIQDIR